MNTGIDYSLALATGLFGAFHCLGMCSGIAGGVFVRFGRLDRVACVGVYHAARVLVYVVLGMTGAAIGRVVVQTGLPGKVQGVLMMGAGLFIGFVGLRMLAARVPIVGDAPDGRIARSRRVAPPDPRGRARCWAPLIGGLYNGFVPCGLVFSVAAKAAVTADPVRAGLLMATFGLGTVPTMAAVSMTGAVVGSRARGWMRRLAGLTLFALGVWTLYQGVVFFDIMCGLGNW